MKKLKVKPVNNKIADLTVSRAYHNDITMGRLFSPHFEKFLVTLELPYMGNLVEKSCIEEGLYEYEIKYSNQAKGDVIWINGVEDRTLIQLHAGTFKKHTLGCLLAGEYILDMDNDNVPDVAYSRRALKFLLESLPKEGTIRISGNTRPGVGIWK